MEIRPNSMATGSGRRFCFFFGWLVVEIWLAEIYWLTQVSTSSFQPLDSPDLSTTWPKSMATGSGHWILGFFALLSFEKPLKLKSQRAQNHQNPMATPSGHCSGGGGHAHC